MGPRMNDPGRETAVEEAPPCASAGAAVSVVICTYESLLRLQVTLPTWGALQGVAEVIVVDAFSTDGTDGYIRSQEASYPVPLMLVSSPLEGLAKARNVGSRVCSGEHILHAGPDNIVPQETFFEMLQLLETNSLVSCSTRLLEHHGYLDRAHELSKRRLLTGPIFSAVGTPYVGQKSLFKEFPFNDAMKHADDAELCARLLGAGHRIYRTSNVCFETGFTSLKDLRERWSRWGASDAQFHQNMRAHWGYRRRLRSLNRAFVAEVVEPARALRPHEYMFGLPFFLTAFFFRAIGRIHEWGRRKKLVGDMSGST